MVHQTRYSVFMGENTSKKILFLNPAVIRLPQKINFRKVENFLTFKDRNVSYRIYNIKKNSFNSYYADKQLKNLYKELHKKVYFYENDFLCTYSGLANELSKLLNVPIEKNIEYPQSSPFPLKKPLPELRFYQQQSIDTLIETKHGSVELPTGSGKSFTFLSLIQRLGLTSLVIAPFSNICENLIVLFKEYLDHKYIGTINDIKSQKNKKIYIVTAQSLVAINDFLVKTNFNQKIQLFVFDESHFVAAKTFKQICVDVFYNVPYRYFFSATQMRNDGSDILLKSIIGNTVYRKTFKDLADLGFLAVPKFFTFTVKDEEKHDGNFDDYENGFVNMNDLRQKFLYNQKILSHAAFLANNFVKENKKVLILIEEFKQREILSNFLAYKHEFISSKTPKKQTAKIINDFNNLKIDILIGTDAISTGTDLPPVNVLIFLKGGKSPIDIRQSIGRASRITPDKKKFIVVDYCVKNHPTLLKHFLFRKKIYEELGEVFNVCI